MSLSSVYLMKKLSLLQAFTMMTLCLCVLTTVVPQVFSDNHRDDGDPREEIAVVTGLVAATAGGIVIGGVIAVGSATAPAWVPVVGVIGAGAGLVSAGCALWDLLDGPEDNCYDCDGSGCNTCEPPDDDDCPNCDGSGCDTCNPPP